VRNVREKVSPEVNLQEERLHLELLRNSKGFLKFLSEILGYQQQKCHYLKKV
jgi:hypothetical protein